LEAQQKAVYSHVNILNSFGSTTKEYFPNVGERLKMKLNLTKLHGNSNRTWKNKSIPTPI
jgi:hypothetical protein